MTKKFAKHRRGHLVSTFKRPLRRSAAPPPLRCCCAGEANSASRLEFVDGLAAGRPFAGKIGELGVDAFDLELQDAAAGKDEFDDAARILAAAREEADGEQRGDRVGIVCTQ